MELIIMGSILAGQKAFFRFGGDPDVEKRTFTRWDKGVMASGIALLVIGIFLR